MTTPSYIVILSDIHIGDNYHTCWYQQSYHEPYLIAVFDWILQNLASVQEVVLLGDLVDFWTYPSSRQPPSFQQVINANPNIFGANGKLNAVLTALQGNVSYVNGNHDISLTQSDLNLLNNPQGYQIKHQGTVHFPDAAHKILCTHGHTFTFFNAPDQLTSMHMPVGHFVTRSVAYMLDSTLQPNQTAADLSGEGAPAFNFAAFYNAIVNGNSASRNSLPKTMLEYMRSLTSMPVNQPVVMPDGTTVDYTQVEDLYSGLWQQWVTEGAAASGSAGDGELYAFKSVYADYNGTYLAWFAQRLAFLEGAAVVATGHTHFPKSGLENSLINYVNSGFMCHAKPDTAKHFNFSLIDTATYTTQVLQVDNSYQVVADPSVPADSIVANGGMDFSCYIIIENSGSDDWTLLTSTLGNGHWIVPPPATLNSGDTVTLWAQDYAGVHGTDGSIIYQNNAGGLLVLHFDCPTGIFPNKASTTLGTLVAKSGSSTAWGAPGSVPSGGHPLFIKVTL